ncbi:MAG TPA: RraA family protein [Geminicoccaceae bacterium]|nr:RraA family protein [Geminicoccaceae bacterium]
MTEPLSEAEVEALRAFDTPTICNALEVVVPERRALGFTTETLICPFPQRQPVVGYARTSLYRAMEPARHHKEQARQARLDYYRYVASGPGPTIAIVQDVDSRLGFGCFWGEVNTAIHKGLGCLGLVTNGGVRDLDAIAPDFQVLCGKVTPSHAHGHTVGFGCEVDVFGMIVRSGDLVHADRHGAVVIPHDAVEKIPAAVDLLARRERVIIEASKQPGFSIERLRQAFKEQEDIH